MNLIHKTLNQGINSKTKLKDAEQIKNKNQFTTTSVFLFFALSIVDYFISSMPIFLVQVCFGILFILSIILFPPDKKFTLGATIQIILISINALFHYFVVPQISFGVLAFILVLPLACMNLISKKGVPISLSVLLIIIIGNFLLKNDEFSPLSTGNLIVFSLSYITITFASTLINANLFKQIDEQVEKVDYYEAEIKQRDEFISNLSHKLRTSLSNITLINNLVHDSRMSSAQKELLDTLRSSTYDLIHDVNDLVEIATPSIIDFKQSILSFNLSEAQDGTFSILHSNQEFKSKVSISEKDDLEYNIIGDPSLLRSILINLVKGLNSFSLDSEKIELSISKNFESQNIYSLNFKLSFSSTDISNIEDTIKNISASTGHQSSLISNACRQLQLTGSKLEFQSELNKGSISFIQDFSKDLTKRLKKTIAPIKDIDYTEKKKLSDCNLLLVEDNAINQKIVLLSLNNLVKGIDVANNGKEALDLFGVKTYDAILMDIQMPVMDGITATKKIREIESTSEKKIPIIAITANALSRDRDNCLAAGVDEYIAKPFQVDDLISKIESLIS